MNEDVRVSVSTDESHESARFHEDSGELEADGAAFSFDLGGFVDGETPDPAADDCYIAPLSEIPETGTMRCEGIGEDRTVEFILRRVTDEDSPAGDSEVLAWRNSCPHQPEVPLDPGGGAIVTDRHLVCHEHGARFVLGDGFCSSGPCQGAQLAPIEVSVEDGHVSLTDDRFEACRRR